jgi:L-asparaginase
VGQPGSDAATNVQNAVKLAVHPRVEIGGVVCLFGTHVLTGTRAKKTTDFGMDAITTVGATATIARLGRTLTVHNVNLARHQGYLARNGGAAKRRRDLQVQPAFDTSGIVSVTEFPGQNLTPIVDAACRDAAKVVVIRAFGSGDVSKAHQSSLEVLKEAGIPVVVGTQIPNGNAHQTANRPGRRVRRRGLGVAAHDMSHEAMTAKLGWLLGQGIEGEDLRQMMTRDLRGEITITTDLRW